VIGCGKPLSRGLRRAITQFRPFAYTRLSIRAAPSSLPPVPSPSLGPAMCSGQSSGCVPSTCRRRSCSPRTGSGRQLVAKNQKTPSVHRLGRALPPNLAVERVGKIDQAVELRTLRPKGGPKDINSPQRRVGRLTRPRAGVLGACPPQNIVELRTLRPKGGPKDMNSPQRRVGRLCRPRA